MTKEQKAKEIIAKIRKGSYEDWVQWIGEGLEEYAAMKAQPLVPLLKRAVEYIREKDTDEGGFIKLASGMFINEIEDAINSYAGSAEEEKDEFKGSNFVNPAPGISIGCITPEARNLLDTIMEAWDSHYKGLKEMHGEQYEPTYYGFAYWLTRWSGLIQPANTEVSAKEPEKKDPWISIEDRLPELGEEVIVWCPGSRGGEGSVTALARFIRYEEDGKYYWDNHYPGRGNRHIQEAITRWMPLPEPPAATNQEGGGKC